MNEEFLKQIFVLLDRCQTAGRSLQIEIEDDLLPLFPVALPVIYNSLSDPFPSAFLRLSSDRKRIHFDNRLHLCDRPDSCDKLHFCRDYLLTSICPRFQSTGKCLHFHSFFTEENRKFLHRLSLEENDPNLFEYLSRIFRYPTTMAEKHFFLRAEKPLTDVELERVLAEHRTNVIEKTWIDPSTVRLTFDDDEVASMMEDMLRKTLPTGVTIHKSLLPSASPVTFGRGRGRTLPSPIAQGPRTFSTRLNPPTASATSSERVIRPTADVAREEKPTMKKYFYREPFNTDQLPFLLGPGRERFNPEEQERIFPSLLFGYCLVKSDDQGRTIEERLLSVIPDFFTSTPVAFPSHLSLLLCSGAAEEIFEQNQRTLPIVSSPTRTIVNIEVKREGGTAKSEGKFHIAKTNSTIEVLAGDIADVPVDMLVCIRTSNTLRESVLRRAGAETTAQYKAHQKNDEASLIDGGSTAAKKILFVPWEIDLQKNGNTQIQKSLGDLVEWAIAQAKAKEFRSISFPPIGTGELNLDPEIVCEAMIGAASASLHQFTMNVFFVIYQSNGLLYENECYQVFRLYLESLCEQIPPSKLSQKKEEIIPRDLPTREICTLSESSDVKDEHQKLIDLVEELMMEETFPLSSINPTLTDKIDVLLDVCLSYHLKPSVDETRDELRLRGDLHSIEECLFNIQKNREVCQYSYLTSDRDGRASEIILSSFVSMRIDQASSLGQTKVSIVEKEELIYSIDLSRSSIEINRSGKRLSLKKKLLYDSSSTSGVRLPSTWSSSSSSPLLINRVPVSITSRLKCVDLFHQTMPKNEWNIEQIESIENIRLFVHHRGDVDHLYFHGCPTSSISSIVHFGLGSVHLTGDALSSHLHGSRRSIDGQHCLFVVQSSQIRLPVFLILYRRVK